MFKKNLSLIATFSVIVIVGLAGYYMLKLKRGQYPVSSFVSLKYKWGVGDTLANSYNSSDGKYQYLNDKDSLVRKNLKLNANEIIFLHSKANELDFWKLPEVIANPNSDLKSKSVLRYEIEFSYEQKTKKIIFLTDYSEDQTIGTSADELQKMIAKVLNDHEERFGN